MAISPIVPPVRPTTGGSTGSSSATDGGTGSAAAGVKGAESSGQGSAQAPVQTHQTGQGGVGGRPAVLSGGLLAGSGNAAAAAVAKLVPGTSLTALVVQSGTGFPGAGSGAAGAAGAAGGAATLPGHYIPAGGSGAAAAAAGAGPALTTGAQLPVKILHFSAPGGGISGGGAANALSPNPGAAVLGGTVIGTSSAGQPVIQTPGGVLALLTRAEVPPGSQVSLELGQPGLAGSGGADAAPPPRLAPGSRMTALFVRTGDPNAEPKTGLGKALFAKGGGNAGLPSAQSMGTGPAGAAGQAAGPNLASGTPLSIRILQLSSPGGVASGMAGGATSGTAGGVASGMPGGMAGATSGGAAGGGAAGTSGALSPSPGATVLTGTVVGTSSTGHPLIQTPGGFLTLMTRAGLAPGSQLSLELSLPATGTGGGKTAGRAASLPDLARSWDGLRDALVHLAETNPAAAQSLTQTVLPNTASGLQLGSGLLFFMTALRGKDPRAFFGEPGLKALDGERGGRSGGAGRLKEEFGKLSRAFEGDGEWRGIFVPVMDGDSLHQMRLYVRRNPNDENKPDEPNAGTRFMLDVSLTELGDVQLDGLVRERRFDLILRTHQALPFDARNDIHGLFSQALAISGFDGSLQFRAEPPLPPPPVAESLETRPDDLYV